MGEDDVKGFKVRDRRRVNVEGEEKKGVAGGEEKEEKNGEGLPPVSFSSFISFLTTTALYHLGDIAHPETKKQEKNLRLARHTIDTIAMLKEKTKGNLTEEETKLIEESLYMLRMRYLKEIK